MSQYVLWIQIKLISTNYREKLNFCQVIVKDSQLREDGTEEGAWVGPGSGCSQVSGTWSGGAQLYRLILLPGLRPRKARVGPSEVQGPEEAIQLWRRHHLAP